MAHRIIDPQRDTRRKLEWLGIAAFLSMLVFAMGFWAACSYLAHRDNVLQWVDGSPPMALSTAICLSFTGAAIFMICIVIKIKTLNEE